MHRQNNSNLAESRTMHCIFPVRHQNDDEPKGSSSSLQDYTFYGAQLTDGIQKPWVALGARLMVLMHESVPASS